MGQFVKINLNKIGHNKVKTHIKPSKSADKITLYPIANQKNLIVYVKTAQRC